MEAILSKKTEGNNAFSAGKYEEACRLWGKCIEEMMALESASGVTDDDFCRMKAVMFLNLAAGNLKLKSYDGSRRCCNAAIVFCNSPELPLSELGMDDDITQDVTLNEPVIPTFVGLAAKALFRRGQCSVEMNSKQQALNDFLAAKSLLPDDKAITDALQALQAQLSKAKANSSAGNDNPGDKNKKKAPGLSQSLIAQLTVNGGIFGKGLGYWSQSIQDCIVYIPLSKLFSSGDDNDGLRIVSKDISVEFEVRQFQIQLKGSNLAAAASAGMHSVFVLEHNIVPSDCLWMLEDLETLSQCLVLHLRKAESVEWFEGCEWWDRVLRDEEVPIDTLTCSVGQGTSDIAQLSERARAKVRQNNFELMQHQQQYQQQPQPQQPLFRCADGSMHPVSELTIVDENGIIQDTLQADGTVGGGGGGGDIAATLQSIQLNSSEESNVDGGAGNGITDGGMIDARLDAETLSWLGQQFPNKTFTKL